MDQTKWKRRWQENRSVFFTVLGMLFVRSALADFYVVPSSSMYPNLLEGDRVICNRLAYDLRVPLTDIILKPLAEPERGDIVVFSSPEDGTRLIKRLIAVPGDVVEMRDEHLIINGQTLDYRPLPAASRPLTPTREYPGQQTLLLERSNAHTHAVILMPERLARRDFGPVQVPQGEYLMLGDNRDNSRDSRYFGFVPRDHITGRARHLFFSLDPDRAYLPRLERWFASL